MLLEVEGLCVNYGRIEAIRDISFAVRGGRGRHPHRRQRRRQDDDDEDHLRPAPGPGRRGHVRRAGHHPHARAQARASWASARRRRVGGIFPGMTVLENLEMGAYVAQGPARRGRAGPGAGLHAVPAAGGAARPVGGTMSGGEQQMLAIGAGADGAGRRCCCSTSRRWGWRPCSSQQIFSIITRDQRAGHDDPAGRAERRAGAQARPTSAYILETGEIVRHGTGARARQRRQRARGLPRRRRLTGDAELHRGPGVEGHPGPAASSWTPPGAGLRTIRSHLAPRAPSRHIGRRVVATALCTTVHPALIS